MQSIVEIQHKHVYWKYIDSLCNIMFPINDVSMPQALLRSPIDNATILLMIL